MTAKPRTMPHRWAVSCIDGTGFLGPDAWGITSGDWAINSPPGPVTFRTRQEARGALDRACLLPRLLRVVKVRARIDVEVVGCTS